MSVGSYQLLWSKAALFRCVPTWGPRTNALQTLQGLGLLACGGTLRFRSPRPCEASD